MSRHLHKMWRNHRGGQWGARIRWYGEGEDSADNIRLNLEDPERAVNIFPDDKDSADQIWFMFKQGAPPKEDAKKPFLGELLQLLLHDKGPKFTADGRMF